MLCFRVLGASFSTVYRIVQYVVLLHDHETERLTYLDLSFDKLTLLSSNLALPRKEIKTGNKYFPPPYCSFEIKWSNVTLINLFSSVIDDNNS